MELHHSSEPEAPEKVTKLFLNTPLDPVTQDVITFSQFRLFAAERLIERSGEPLQLGGRVKDRVP
jgi:hypothetical protein